MEYAIYILKRELEIVKHLVNVASTLVSRFKSSSILLPEKLDRLKQQANEMESAIKLLGGTDPTPLHFVEWVNKGLWSKTELRDDKYYEVNGWYNTHNYASMKQPISTTELFDLFLSESKNKS